MRVSGKEANKKANAFVRFSHFEQDLGETLGSLMTANTGSSWNDNLHWLAEYCHGFDLISCLDLEKEQFQILDPPPGLSQTKLLQQL